MAGLDRVMEALEALEEADMRDEALEEAVQEANGEDARDAGARGEWLSVQHNERVHADRHLARQEHVDPFVYIWL